MCDGRNHVKCWNRPEHGSIVGGGRQVPSGTGCKMPVFPKNKSWCFDAIERVSRERLERGTCRGGFSWSLGMLVVGTVALRVRCWN